MVECKTETKQNKNIHTRKKIGSDQTLRSHLPS